MNKVNVIQKPLSNKHKSAMFFDGFVAEGMKDNIIYYLMTYQNGEILRSNVLYCADEIRYLVEIEEDIIDDDNINSESDIDILSDRFLTITNSNQIPIDIRKYLYIDFDTAINGFKDFLNS